MNWEPINLVTVEQRPSVRPTLGSLRFIYPGRRHVFSGPPESLKTLVAQIETLEVIRAGGRVVLVDLETGPWDTRDRLRDLGATDDELAAVLYIEPDTPPTEETIAVLVALAPDLVVIDAAAGAYDLAGLDDNKRADVERFASLYVRGFWKAGIATILLDHVVKSTESRGRYAIGSERKLGGCDVHLGFETVKPLHRGSTGLVRVTVHKDRFGHLPRPTWGCFASSPTPRRTRSAGPSTTTPAKPTTHGGPPSSWRKSACSSRTTPATAQSPEARSKKRTSARASSGSASHSTHSSPKDSSKRHPGHATRASTHTSNPSPRPARPTSSQLVQTSPP
jgi:hypothetical protein